MSSDLEVLLRAVGNSTRRSILSIVWENDLAAGDIAAQIDLAAASVSEHLKVLRKAGLVTVDKQGTSWIYRAERSAITRLLELLRNEFPESENE